jgi:hypothetical protein
LPEAMLGLSGKLCERLRKQSLFEKNMPIRMSTRVRIRTLPINIVPAGQPVAVGVVCYALRGPASAMGAALTFAACLQREVLATRSGRVDRFLTIDCPLTYQTLRDLFMALSLPFAAANSPASSGNRG